MNTEEIKRAVEHIANLPLKDALSVIMAIEDTITTRWRKQKEDQLKALEATESMLKEIEAFKTRNIQRSNY